MLGLADDGSPDRSPDLVGASTGRRHGTQRNTRVRGGALLTRYAEELRRAPEAGDFSRGCGPGTGTGQCVKVQRRNGCLTSTYD
jgi:hypothetical protein